MEQRVEKILNVIKDYRNDDGIQLTEKDITDWADQFGADRDFVLDEFGHIVNQVYLSKAEGVQFLESVLKGMAKYYQYPSVASMLNETCFLKMQPQGKSQSALLEMIDEILNSHFGKKLADFDSHPKKHYIYVDDVLSTGGTLRADLIKWLDEGNNASDVKAGTKTLAVVLVCSHYFGESITKFFIRNKYGLTEKQLPFLSCYSIENHLQYYVENQKLNAAIPIASQTSKRAHDFLKSLPQEANKYENYTFRLPGYPKKEVFFSSPENRDRYEQILIERGLDIISNIQNPGTNTRPLGLVSPRYRTLGLGTHFFTWRNVPNNCPLVYWWSVPGHNWKPLFPKR